MLYLAKTYKRRNLLNQGCDFQLLAQLEMGMKWKKLAPPKLVLTCHHQACFKDETLVIVNLDNNNAVVEVRDALDIVISGLVNHSLCQEKLRRYQNEIDIWKRSLHLQVEILEERQLDLETTLENLLPPAQKHLVEELKVTFYQHFLAKQHSESALNCETDALHLIHTNLNMHDTALVPKNDTAPEKNSLQLVSDVRSFAS